MSVEVADDASQVAHDREKTKKQCWTEKWNHDSKFSSFLVYQVTFQKYFLK